MWRRNNRYLQSMVAWITNRCVLRLRLKTGGELSNIHRAVGRLFPTVWPQNCTALTSSKLEALVAAVVHNWFIIDSYIIVSPCSGTRRAVVSACSTWQTLVTDCQSFRAPASTTGRWSPSGLRWREWASMKWRNWACRHLAATLSSWTSEDAIFLSTELSMTPPSPLMLLLYVAGKNSMLSRGSSSGYRFISRRFYRASANWRAILM